MMYLPLVIKIIGKEYREGLEVVPILLLANLFLGIFYYLSQWYKQTNRTLMGASIAVAGALITLLINFIFIPAYGYMASAWATFVCYAFMAVSSYILGQKYYPVKYDLKRISTYIGTAVFLYLLSNTISARPLGDFSLVMYILNTLFIVGYAALFLYLEKPAFINRLPVMRHFNSSEKA